MKGSVTMPLPQDRIYTIDDIYALPEGTRAELIDGQIYYQAAPSRNHQDVLNYINNTIYNHIQANNGKCKVYPAPFAVFLNEDDTIYLEPDITVVCDQDKLDDVGCKGAPDWIVEVVSPSSKPMDYYTKLFKYRNAGVREYWIVDPGKEIISAHFFEAIDGPYIFSFKDKVKVNIYDTLEIDFSQPRF